MEENYRRLSVRLSTTNRAWGIRYRFRTRSGFTVLKKNVQLRKEIRGENQVLALKENYWRLRVRLATINRAWEICYRFRTRSGFTVLKKTNIQVWQEIRSGNQVPASEENCWILSVRLSTICRAWELCYRY